MINGSGDCIVPVSGDLTLWYFGLDVPNTLDLCGCNQWWPGVPSCDQSLVQTPVLTPVHFSPPAGIPLGPACVRTPPPKLYRPAAESAVPSTSADASSASAPQIGFGASPVGPVGERGESSRRGEQFYWRKIERHHEDLPTNDIH